MQELGISRDDIEVLAQVVDTTTLPDAPKALLSAIVDTIRDVADRDNVAVVLVTVDVATEPQDEFATAFTADSAHAPAGIKAAFMKIGR